jgi:hypothetical protein
VSDQPEKKPTGEEQIKRLREQLDTALAGELGQVADELRLDRDELVAEAIEKAPEILEPVWPQWQALIEARESRRRRELVIGGSRYRRVRSLRHLGVWVAFAVGAIGFLLALASLVDTLARGFAGAGGYMLPSSLAALGIAIAPPLALAVFLLARRRGGSRRKADLRRVRRLFSALAAILLLLVLVAPLVVPLSQVARAGSRPVWWWPAILGVAAITAIVAIGRFWEQSNRRARSSVAPEHVAAAEIRFDDELRKTGVNGWLTKRFNTARQPSYATHLTYRGSPRLAEVDGNDWGGC